MILLLMSIPAQSSAAQSAPRDCTRPTAGNATALAQILDANCLVVGVIDYPPFSTPPGNGWTGFESDLARILAQEWFGDAAAVRFENIGSRENGVDWLGAGRVDLMIATSFPAAVLETTITFSAPYLADELTILVPAANVSNTLADLSGKPVAVVGGPLVATQAQLFFAAQGVQIDSIDIAEGGTAAAVTSLRNGGYAAVIGSQLHLADALQSSDFVTLPVDAPLPAYQIAVQAGEPELVQWLDCTLAAMRSDPTTWQDLQATLPLPVAPMTITMPAGGCAGVVLHSLPLPQPPVTPTPPPTPTTPSAIQTIRDRGVLVAGVKADAPSFGVQDEDGEWSGFEIDLMREFARRWLGSAEDIEFVQVTSANRIQRLVAGDVDLLAATMTHRQERDAVIDFSQTYYLDGQNILVRADAEDWPATDAARIQMLDGKRIAAIEGSTSLRRIQEFARENALTIEVVEFEQYDQAIQPLLDGNIDAITTDRGILTGLALNDPGLTILLDQNFSNEPYGIGVRSGDAYFADQVNYTLQGMKADGTYDAIYQQWFCATAALRQACDPYKLETLPGAPPYTFTTAPISMTTVITGASVVDKLIAQGFFEAGVKYDAPPFGYRNEAGELVGFEVELMREFARRWLGDANAVEFTQVTSRDRITQLVESNIDMIAATMTHSKGRDANIDFSQTYYLDGQNILVRRDAGLRSRSDDARIQALDGARIGAIQGSTSINRIRAFATEHDITLEIAEFEQYDQAIQALLDENIVGITTDRGILIGFAQQYPELVVLLDRGFSEEPYGLGLPQGDARFRDLVNFTLQAMKADGTYDLLYRYWFGISFIMQEQGLDEDERTDIIRRYWIDDPENPVTDWQPYALEAWPGINYFVGPLTAAITVPVRNDLAPLIFIAGGPSFLGTTSKLAKDRNQHPGRNQEQLVVQVDDFWIDQHEVTNHQYRQCVDLGFCAPPQKLDILGADYFYAAKYKNHPVVQVTWQQAQNYCAAFGKTLPTEAQWEKAARYDADAESGYLYPWGDEEDNIELRATYANSVYRQDFANPVGIYRFDIPAPIHGFTEPLVSLRGASPFDVLDMAGNVQEWTADCYEQEFYARLAAGSPAALQNPTTAAQCNAADERTVRSSGYYDQKYTLATVFRQGKAPDSVDLLRGFRCVAPPEGAPATRLHMLP